MAPRSGRKEEASKALQRRTDPAWQVDWDAVPMAPLIDDAPPPDVPPPHAPAVEHDEADESAPEPAQTRAPTGAETADAETPVSRRGWRGRKRRRRSPDLEPPIKRDTTAITAPRRRRRRARRTSAHGALSPRITVAGSLVVLAVMASAAAGSYLLTQKSAKPADVGETGGRVQGSSEIAPEIASEIAPEAAPEAAPETAPETAPAPDSRREYPSREDFEVSGVRFRVVPGPQQDWARTVSATDPGEGRRWELVWVLYRNVSRQRLFAEDLRFRLKNADNFVYAPVEGVGNGGSDLERGTQIFPGTQVKAQLAFSVPADEGELWLILNPGVNTRIRVALGSP